MSFLKNPIWAVILFALFCAQLAAQSWQLKRQNQVIEILNSFTSYDDLKKTAHSLSDAERASLSRELKRVKPDFLNPCQSLNFYDFQSHLAPKKEFSPTIMWQEEIVDDKKTLVNVSKELPITAETLKNAAFYYSGKHYTLDDLRQVADNEVKEVSLRLSKLDEKIKAENIADSLDDLLDDPNYYESDDDKITQRYEYLISKAIYELRAPFKNYAPAPVRVIILHKPQYWNARASYNENLNALQLYITDITTDLRDSAFLVVHEVLGGHHLQASAQHRDGGICQQPATLTGNAIIEGWATYAEDLADETGFYDSPQLLLGWLDYRLIRAGRIYMDIERVTNGDNKDRLQAVWNEKLPERLHKQFENEYGRLSTARHRHLSYLLGRNAILQLKQRLVKQYGEDLDLRIFHDAIMRGYFPGMTYFDQKVVISMQKLSDDNKPIAPDAAG